VIFHTAKEKNYREEKILVQLRSDWEKIPACRRRSSDIDAQVGTRIRVRREQLGMSHDDLARAVQISCRALRSYEAGTAPSTPAEFCAIATTLGVSLSYFFEEGCCGDGVVFQLNRGSWFNVTCERRIASIRENLT